MKEKLKVWLTGIIFMSLVCGGIYLMMLDGDKERAYNLEKVKRNYRVGKGVITKIFNYKGNSVYINYTVDGKPYTYSGGYASNPEGLDVGDSIVIKYAIDSPQYAISELDENYKTF